MGLDVGIKKIEAYLSGGATNTDPDLSLGGVISATKLVSQTIVYTSTSMSGVSLVDASNINQAIELHYDSGTTELYLTESPQLLTEIRVNVSVDGVYILPMPDESGIIEVTVVNASLPTSESHDITTSTIINNLFDPVTSQNSQVGDINYRHLYFKNLDIATFNFLVTILNQLNGMDYLEIGIEQASSGADDTLLANENTPPPGVTFSAPSNISDATELSASISSYVGVFFKRTVIALTDTSTDVDSAVIEITESI